MPSTAIGQRTSRRAFVSRLLDATPEALVIAGLGSAAYDVFAAGDRKRNFYLWGAMGGATSIGLGLALAQPQQSVVVITPTTPSGCHCSIIRWPGRSDPIVRP